MRTCACGTAVADYQAFCPSCTKVVPSKGRIGRMPVFLRIVIALVAAGSISGYAWLIVTSLEKGIAESTSSMNDKEQAAMENISNLVFAQKCFLAGSGKFAQSIEELHGLVRPDLLSGSSGGYIFRLTGTGKTFEVRADPEDLGEKANRSFLANQSGHIIQIQKDLGTPESK